ELPAGPDQALDRIDRIQSLGPEQLVVPGVLADGKRDLIATEREHTLAFGRCEVAHLVEDVIGGQQHLRLQEGDLAILQERGGVHHGLASLGMRGSDQAADHGYAWRRRGNLFGSLTVARDEAWPFD